MRLVKQLFLGVAGMGLILFLISLPLPSQVNVSKSILVSNPKDSVLASLLHLKEWQQWNPMLQDSSVVYSFETEQAVEWTTHDQKTNRIKLTMLSADTVYAVITTDNEQAFKSGFSVTQNRVSNNFTKIDWWIHEDLGWLPWEKFYGLFTESLKEEYLENTLQSLKRHLENNNH
ncbi:MAG: SRPBCC family protein [Chitinophagaceae bacterium]|nr:SRPBCC family protein [Chitinophagaceae bacterium]MCW5928766.1 SRPBCC family protein [Chitinophagaceae bacterium]